MVKSKSLVIVESPSKTKTLKKFLGKDFVVEASVGHIKNLPDKELGVDVGDGYKPKYVTIRGKGNVIKKLKQSAKKADAVYIATDPDREGEAIAWHIAKEIEKETENKPVHRILVNEITKSGVDAAMKSPGAINEMLVQSQQARRIMDRLVGYKVSPFLWKTIYKGLSAGRVQSVALHLVCEREREIQAFKQEEYWSITAGFAIPAGDQYHGKLVKIAGKKAAIPDGKTAAKSVDDIRKLQFTISDVTRKEVKRNPLPPFTTSSLQQAASTRLRFGTKKTMRVAQQLYEGVELGAEGAVGLITYMRTDSSRIAPEALKAVASMIKKTYGAEYALKSPRVFKSKARTQDAHEAIRPASLENTPEKVKPYLSREQYALYELIWTRFVASQMAAAVLDQTVVVTEGGKYQFKSVGSTYKFRGYLQVYDDFASQSRSEDEAEEESLIPAGVASGLNVETTEVLSHQHFTKPPPRYTESSLVKELDTLGIGRPSTYALIVSTIQDRGYVEQKERRLYATELGMDVDKILQEYFEQIFNVNFTAEMEQELDTIATGERDYKKVLDEFYKPFSKLLESIDVEKATLVQETDEKCDKCGSGMIIRWGRNGKFLACSKYPECKNTKPLPGTEPPELDEKCPECGNPLVIKQSRYGQFIGCSGYPECRFTRPITLGIACPKCKEGEIVERKSGRGRFFYGCSRYPECDFVSWDKPVPHACPACQHPFLVSKFTQRKGEFYKCPACKKEFDRELEPLDQVDIAA
ncbi:MAG: type I DNA topoisomerase [Chlorobi bacterium]|nr:type I DNA topoisomerase [Chlorobiota bacterium]